MAFIVILTLLFALLSSTFHVLSHAQMFPQSIILGSFITAGTNGTWRSLSGDFAFGFYPLSTGSYLVGIWFDKIPQRTLVWSANRNDPAEPGSIVRLTSLGLLWLEYSNGSVLNIHSGAPADLGIMQNDGNLVLRDATGSGNFVWQSFDHPTNTLLPGQVVNRTQRLYSNAKDDGVDYSTGNFALEMQLDGNLLLSAYRFAEPAYYYSIASPYIVSLVFDNSSALMYLVNSTNHNNTSLTKNVPNPVGDYYHRATIDEFGNFQQYVFHKNNGTRWERVWRAVNEPCLVTSICGVNGFCSSPNNETFNCKCLQGYIPLDPNSSSKGCRPETLLNYCADTSMRIFTVEVIDDADFPCGVYADLARVTNVDVDGCKKALMENCDAVSASLTGSRCLLKRTPLLTARTTASTKGIKALIKVPFKISGPGIPNNDHKRRSNTRVRVKAGLLTSSILALLFGAIALKYNPTAQRLIRRKRSLMETAIGINFREFTYQELREATNGFSEALGQGSSGKVYHGVVSLKGQHIKIAVKKLEKAIEQSEKEFLTELKIIGRTHHKNLVRLLGFCIEDEHRLLVYEFMENGTLSDTLFKGGVRVSWSQRSEMALGIARGLLYLHEECVTQIIHCDIKPQNVLLDAYYTAKISDFGLSKLLNKDQTRTDTQARGTIGYIAPEWLRHGPITTKADVYSFGVMLLEISCARRNVEVSRVDEESEEEDLVLTSWVLSCLRSGKLESVVRHDPEVLSDFKRFERIVMVALWCVSPDPYLRPSMKKVNQMLEGTMEVGIPPLVYHQ